MSEASLGTNTAARPVGARERLQELGLESLSDSELVALLLGTGTRAAPVGRLADNLLNRAGGLRGLATIATAELQQVPGVGRTKAARIVASLELGRRVHAQPLLRGAPIRSSEDVYRSFAPQLVHLQHEELWALALDVRHRVQARILLGRGGLSSCPLTPADVFRPLIREAASALVLVHNHPSGVAEPSSEDLHLTSRLAQAGKLLGITLVDHVIVASEGYTSLLDAGLLHPD